MLEALNATPPPPPPQHARLHTSTHIHYELVLKSPLQLQTNAAPEQLRTHTQDGLKVLPDALVPSALHEGQADRR
jgi:hypothetical protein